jgi:hypothetical protein
MKIRRADLRVRPYSVAILVVSLVVSAATARQPRPQPVRATLAQLAWLPGVWRGETGPVSFEERWTPAAGGLMLAVSRTMKGAQLVSFEFLRIVERDGGLIYVAQPEGRPPTEFALTAVAPDAVTFENPGHDFPRMIRYSRRPDGRLEARVSDGGQRGETFLFTRAP